MNTKKRVNFLVFAYVRVHIMMTNHLLYIVSINKYYIIKDTHLVVSVYMNEYYYMV